MLLECYYRSNPIDENRVPLKAYRQRMRREWLELGPFGDVTEQIIYEKAKTIRKNGWLTETELEMIKWRITGTQGTAQKENQNV